MCAWELGHIASKSCIVVRFHFMPLHCWRYDSCVYRIFGWKLGCVYYMLCCDYWAAQECECANWLKKIVTVVTNKPPYRIVFTGMWAYWLCSWNTNCGMTSEHSTSTDQHTRTHKQTQSTDRQTDQPTTLSFSFCPWKTFPLIGESETNMV